MSRSTLSAHRFSIARALALQVRMMTHEQIARGWYHGEASATTLVLDTLERLQRAGLVESLILESHPFVVQSRPLFVWKANQAWPDEKQFEELAKRSQNRWHMAHRPVKVWRATKRACHAFGAFTDAQEARHCEATHDLHLAEVFVLYRETRARAAQQWLGEGAFPKLGFQIRGMKDPDAFLVDQEGNGVRVIELTGKYEAKHLIAFHAHCAGGAAKKLARATQARKATALSRLYPPEGIGYELW